MIDNRDDLQDALKREFASLIDRINAKSILKIYSANVSAISTSLTPDTVHNAHLISADVKLDKEKL